MSFTIEDAENAVATWLNVITGAQIYFLDSNVGRPPGLYGMLRLMTTTQVGTPVEKITPETINGDPWVKRELNTNFTANFSINFYRKGARNLAAILESGEYLNGAAEILYNANIGFVKSGTAQDLSQVVEGNFEERAQIDLTFNLVGYAVEDLNTITSVQINNLSANITSEVSL